MTNEGSTLYQALQPRVVPPAALPARRSAASRRRPGSTGSDRMPDFLRPRDPAGRQPGRLRRHLRRPARGVLPRHDLAVRHDRRAARAQAGPHLRPLPAWLRVLPVRLVRHAAGRRQSLASIRFGAPKSLEVHGHEDSGALGYFAFGRQVLWQPGSVGRRRRPAAALRPEQPGPQRDRHRGRGVRPHGRDARSSPRPAARPPTWSRIDSPALAGATWRRTMVHVKAPELLVVDDRVTQLTNRSVLQRWHLGADRTVTTARCGRADTSGPGLQRDVPVDRRLSAALGRDRADVSAARLAQPAGQRVRAGPHPGGAHPGRLARMTTIIVPRPSGVRPRATSRCCGRASARPAARPTSGSGRRVHRVTVQHHQRRRCGPSGARPRPRPCSGVRPAAVAARLGRVLVEVQRGDR